MGEILTRGTIWMALVLYAWGAVWWLGGRRLAGARAVWTLGCAAFVAHVICAFQFYHAWSHADALAETARQTEEMTGFPSGSGLYLNYVFGLAWLGMVTRWWVVPGALEAAPGQLGAWWNGFALFMIFNGTVVFGRGPIRWVGWVLCGAVGVAWWRQSRRAWPRETA